ncbi:uncharacterized protein BT62DRAFT_1072633 [Guyanagaster necrorhizus]|uniref:BRCT domain-containing protein n=1 Tax=Guyanagaster necrorhizus TaxID=856835 RepID=A0A9P7W1Q3_9AGAR|nr:uncharacterized protein BT62DRAFT_1072633 [Guyanagaster necrorhizus MCA 3950]KAG7450578.1 hypothetical protein BT62DRAFT_1072633 [Guyanagaster necrorhizus MCA 3950]
MSVKLLPSQPLDDSVSPLFLDAGAIFVDPGAGGIIGRPKLLRLLRKLGALLCHDPGSAKYILVHPQSNTGRQFIRDWGTDADKIVLNHQWVQKCSTTRKVLGADDNWGGCATHDDGLPIGSPDEKDVNPLPTPRETPVDIRPSPMKSSSTKRTPSKSPAQSKPESPTSHPSPPRTANDTQTSVSIVPPALSDTSSNIPQVYQNIMSQPGASVGSAAPNPPFFPPPMMHPDMMQQFFHQMNLINHMMQQSMPDHRHPLYGALVDSCRNHLGQISQEQFSFPPNNSAHSLRSPAYHCEAQQLDCSTSTSLSRSHSLESSVPIQSSSQKFSSSKESARNQSPIPRSPTMPSARPSQLPTAASPASNILTDPETGEGLNFFVEVNMGFSTQRSVTTAQIKKHGGKLAHQKELADYCILSQKCKTFNTDLSEAVYYDVPAVNASFVTDCVNAKRLLDHSDYLFDIPPKLQNKRKGHQKQHKQGGTPVRAEVKAKVERKWIEENLSMSQNKRLNPEEDDKLPKRRKTGCESTHSQPTLRPIASGQDLRSPSPPPEHTRVLFSEGRYRYTLEEREYVQAYAEVLLKRDINITNIAIADRLFKKMPHHSNKSWREQIQKHDGFRTDIETLRKRVGIAQRLKRKKAPVVEQNLFIEEAPLPAAASPLPSADIQTGPPQRNLFEEDLKAIVDFFALDGADEDEDEPDVIWAKLTSKMTCQTAASWADFHCQHHVEIQRRYELLAESNNDGT